MYSRELLRLALRLAEQGRLQQLDACAERRSRTCGSSVVADVRMNGERVAGFGQEVRACAVGQASAAILGGRIVGMKRAEVDMTRRNIANYLKGLQDTLGSWSELNLLAAARDHPARHAAMLLPYDAALAAIDEALSASRNAATSAS